MSLTARARFSSSQDCKETWQGTSTQGPPGGNRMIVLSGPCRSGSTRPNASGSWRSERKSGRPGEGPAERDPPTRPCRCLVRARPRGAKEDEQDHLGSACRRSAACGPVRPFQCLPEDQCQGRDRHRAIPGRRRPGCRCCRNGHHRSPAGGDPEPGRCHARDHLRRALGLGDRLYCHRPWQIRCPDQPTGPAGRNA